MALQKLLILAAVFISAPLAAQESDSSLRAELTSRYAAMKNAMANRDETAIRSLLADGFVSVDVNGKSEGASDMIKEVLALPADPSRRSQTTIVSVSRVGNAAVVEQRYEMTKKAKAPDGTEKSAALSTLSIDTWIEENGSWRIAKTLTKQLDYTVDGKALARKVSGSAD